MAGVNEKSTMKKSIGICIGSSSISFVHLVRENTAVRIEKQEYFLHRGNPREAISRYFEENPHEGVAIVTTGKAFKDILKAHTISEAEAVERSVRHYGYAGQFGAVASLGGETFMVYSLDKEAFISNVITGNKCASGTGEFFLQQIRRMDMTMEEAIGLASENKPYHVSGRCSVFCKSDCTHALNKGINKGEVTSGLCKMIALKVVELLSQQESRKVLLIGGMTKNKSVIGFILEEYPLAAIAPHAPSFEALGAAIAGLDLDPFPVSFKEHSSRFTFHKSLSSAKDKVTFQTMRKDIARDGDECILGLDVGSTTTKAVLLRTSDDSMLASVYLRTNGNPLQASVECYQAIHEEARADIKIIGLGVTGSGRHIAGIHAMTRGIINEIIAHAAASSFFDKEVDTIFEIGGQDAKYTFLTNGIASDYAMNEACSAGTGSFLEESAKESLGIDYKDISELAMSSSQPPNFNDQCAAFISSDIKTAQQEGIAREDIVAGLVYSICMNYVNRVKGNRPMGRKVFMQGGVCYNKSVPIAMSALIDKEIVVPPEPGLMGAFGVALEIKQRIGLGLMERQDFSLPELIGRTFHNRKSFICPGGSDGCDIGCEINIIEIEGKNIPFGGACSKYFNERLKITSIGTNYVEKRQELVFTTYASLPKGKGKRIGILKSFLTNSFYPLYYNFFTKLGLEVVLSDTVKKAGGNRMRSSFCFPVEISYGLMQDLIDKKVDYIFLPHVTELNNPHEDIYKRTCVFVQGEPYYLSSAFDGVSPPLIKPIINFSSGQESIRKEFIKVAVGLGFGDVEGGEAFDFASAQQSQLEHALKELGKLAIKEVESDPEKTGMVVFGRPYNAFAKEANMGIPRKYASKGVIIIPHDILPTHSLASHKHMYWFWGQVNLRNARFVAGHRQLFGTYITNFSCGPDSFILSYFRKIMGMKPSLTLELDSHSSDAGVETRIDAALDIIRGYRELDRLGRIPPRKKDFIPMEIKGKKKIEIISRGKTYRLTSPEVQVLVPSMGRFGTSVFAAVFRSIGINAHALEVPSQITLKHGRAHSTCKECLPFILTTGSMLEYLGHSRKEGVKYLFFMPHGYGPCRQGQYHVRVQDIINELRLEDAAVLSLNDENSYGGLGLSFTFKAWMGMVISDGVSDIENALKALAIDREGALALLEEEWAKVIIAIESGNTLRITSQLKALAKRVKAIPLKMPYDKAKKISLIGEAYVRREEFSRVDLIETLADNGFVVKVAPIAEFIYYVNYLALAGIRKRFRGKKKITFSQKARLHAQHRMQRMVDSHLKSIMAGSGLYENHHSDIETTLKHSQDLISVELLGEAVLTVGLALREIVDHSCGVITLGPFACMPSRLAESLLTKEMSQGGKGFDSLPYLNIETDGNAYPQLIRSRLEIFMLQAERLHKKLEMK